MFMERGFYNAPVDSPADVFDHGHGISTVDSVYVRREQTAIHLLVEEGRQFSFPTTSPSQFQPAQLHHSIDRMLSLAPEAIYVTHFGRLTNPAPLGEDLHRLIDAHAQLGERHRRAGTGRKRLLKEGVSELVLAERERQGWRLPSEKVLEVFALDIELNAQGIESWLDTEGK